MESLNANYWNERYQAGQIPWDIGYASPPLLAYAASILDKQTRILIPGAGHAYEAVALHQRGFGQIFVCDWAPLAFTHLRQNAPDFPENNLLVADFFTLDLQVDLILEQTFFCAIDPALRPNYVAHAAKLLAPGGTLAGVLFANPFPFPGPPFGGTAQEYTQLFSKHFSIRQLALCEQSIKPRAGRELFLEAMVSRE